MMPSIAELSAEILQNPAIQSELGDHRNDLDERYIKAELLKRSERIEEEAGGALSEQREAARAHAHALGQYGFYDRPRWYGRAALYLWAGAAVIGAVLALLWMAGFADPWAWYYHPYEPDMWTIFAAAIWIYAGVAIAASLLALWWRFLGRDRALSYRFGQLRLGELHEKDIEAERRASDQLKKIVEANVLDIINEFKDVFFQDKLVLTKHVEAGEQTFRVATSYGLSEVEDPAQEVPTPHRQKLLELLENLPGASIGVSGARGVGKSTILRSICGTLKIGGKEAIAVYTSSPVRYDAREFLLHLYSILCLQVLRTLGEPDDADDLPVSRPPLPFGLAHPRLLGRVLFLTGSLMALIGLAFAFLARLAAPAAQVANSSGPPAASAPPSLIGILDFQPGPLVMWGVAAAILGWILLLQSGGYFYRPLYRSESIGFDEEDSAAALAEAARAALRDIRFQRSFTSGWSGSLKIPLGFEAGSTTSLAMAQRPHSLPELVESFREFVKRVTRSYHRVIVAIDELDKIRSASDAEEFLNEIKSIFNIPRCFYLVSVSENAISSFERRGLAIRDAFDSAFDDIHFVGPLDLEGSRRLLSRRLLNLPGPFLCLCHVLSGGLPRDLIRIARFMVATAGSRPAAPTVAALAEAIVEEEVSAKLRASAIAARDFVPDPQAGTLLVGIAQLEGHAPGSASFRELVGKMAAPPPPAAAATDPPPAPDADAEKIAAITNELAVYLEFLDLVLLLGGAMQTEADWRSAEGALVEALARARQSLETNPDVARVRFEAVKSLLAAA